ncbi:replication protein A 70 kDa DNA-binding subunit [Striga asiatica]|uniref:Replication protein A 70 kDa DNA-binding subunit n=1 Tax=Striga asiatica TaxID=4170 RepID=A0A5A7QSA1_STRAF|nr:replication protein A 70 kDa DNA-binding subunit [Striga asiatica]
MARAWGNIKQVTRTNRPMLKLRVVRVFLRTNQYSSYKNLLEIVFHDNEGGQITGIVRAINIPTFKDEFEEGAVYAFRNYQIHPVQMKNVKGVQTRMIAFSLMDPEGNILPCTLWGTYVDQFLNYENQLAHNGNPWPLIIQLVRSREWDEKVQVTSSKDITRLITGQNIPDIVGFVNRAAAGPLSRTRLISKSAIIVKSELQELADGDVVVSAVDSLFATAEETDVWICATAESIIDEWWYHSCRRCTSKMEEVHGQFTCSKCAHKFGIYRPCDALRREMIQKNSTSIELPDEIDNMIQKSYLFKVRIRQNRRNFRGVESAFFVVRMIADENLVSKYSQWVTMKEDSDFLTLCLSEEANNSKDPIGEEEVSTPVKSLKGKEKIRETSNAKKNLMDSLEDEVGFAAHSAIADKGKTKVIEHDDETKDNFGEELSG